MIVESNEPNPFSTNIFIESWDRVEYPIIAPIPSLATSNEVAIVAIVTATNAKIDFAINVRCALIVSVLELLRETSWIEQFFSTFTREPAPRSFVDVKGNTKGWTTAILREAMHPYRARYHTRPRCMVGVFGGINKKLFWTAFDKRIHPEDVAEMKTPELLNTAADCIQVTPFWSPRLTLRYTRLQFDVDELKRREVAVRAFRDDLDGAEIEDIAKRSPKIYDGKQGENWGFAYDAEPASGLSLSAHLDSTDT